MADITMCSGKTCHKKENCYRFTATPSEFWQSYFIDLPVHVEGECTMYWPNDEEIKEQEND